MSAARSTTSQIKRLVGALVLRCQPLVCQAEQERYDLVNLNITQAKDDDLRVLPRVLCAAFVVVIDHIPQRFERTVVHVGGGQRDVAKWRGAERANLVFELGDQGTAELAVLADNVRSIDRSIAVAGAQFWEGLAGEILVVVGCEADADVVEVAVGEQRLAKVDWVARRAVLAKQLEAGLRIGGDRIFLPGAVFVEWGVEEYQRALERGERACDIFELWGATVGELE